ncbi:hypothetical protein GCM10020254_61960 [Streptomyces goshikiensis]
MYRCWSQAEDGRLPAFPSPEIRIADLAQFALQAACWGDPDAAGLALPDPPPAGAMAAAREVLVAVGAVTPDGRATPRGVGMSRLGLHPRLARALLDGAAAVGPRRAAELVALLSEEPPREYGDDLAAAWRRARAGGDAYATRWRAEATRLRRSGATPAGPSTPTPTVPEPEAAAPLPGLEAASRRAVGGSGPGPPRLRRRWGRRFGRVGDRRGRGVR